MIYADNAATTRLDPDAFEAMRPWLLDSYGNPSQPYAFARGPRKALGKARETIAACIGAVPEEIFFTSGGTESDNWAVKCSCGSILTSAFEHHAVLNACGALERRGTPVTYISPSVEGYIEPEDLKRAIVASQPNLVSLMYANNELGTIQPIFRLCEIAHACGAVFHTDAVQAVGHVSLDVHALGVDFLSASAHKFNGPRGVGFLYIRRGAQIPSYMDGGSQENGHRAGTENVAGIVGMAVALQKNCENMIQTQRHLRSLETELLEELDASGIRYRRNGGGPESLPGILSLSFPNFEGEVILHRLDLAGICISTGSACDGANMEISHVLRAIELPEELASGTVRISLGRENTVEDVECIAGALLKVLCGR